LGAGAFLSPKLSKPSRYKNYLNTALEFSLDFYQKNFPSTFKRVPLHKHPKDSHDWQKLQSYQEFIEFDYEKKQNHYILNFAGIVDPKELCYALLENITYHENTKIQSLEEFKDCNIIITHPNQTYVKEPYLKTKNIAGYRYDVRFDNFEKKDFNSHKDVSISCYFKNKVAIGATYIKNPLNLKQLAQDDSFELLQKAKEFFDMPNLEVLDIFTGYRNMTYEFFPILGALIDSKQTLKNYPYIKNGSKVPLQKYSFHQDIYIHTALGSRGFVYAPYNAKLLVDAITSSTQIPKELSTQRLFLRWCQKDSKKQPIPYPKD